jgi:ATP/maltotriose-dependent transcriptional regulator MalT
MTLYALPRAARAEVAKIPLPIDGSGPIPRTRLLERLAVVADDVPLVLFTAPAGYGKTRALNQWAAVDGRWFGRVRLSEADSDPLRLAGLVALALNRLVGLDPAVLRSLAAGYGSRARALPHLLASLHRRSLPGVLVLDDAHELRNVEAIHFIRALAAGVSARTTWRFTDDEARQVLAGAGVVCSDQEVAALVRRTRSWPAAVYLSALASGASPGEHVRVQLPEAAWDGQGGRATDATIHAMDDHRATARLSASLARVESHPPVIGATSLSRAEMRVLQLLPTHLSLSEIGDRLHISRNTVKSHVAAVYRKLGCSTRNEVVVRGRDLGLLEP